MTTLSEFAGKTLTLQQPALFKERYEIVFEDELAARLIFPKFFKTYAEGEIADKKWLIKRHSFWSRDIDIYKMGNEIPSYKFISKSWGREGQVQLDKGKTLDVVFNLLKNHFKLKTSGDKLLISGQEKSGFKSKILFDIVQADENLDQYPWLILLLAYIQIRRKHSRSRSASMVYIGPGLYGIVQQILRILSSLVYG